jgi:hypothetical protein
MVEINNSKLRNTSKNENAGAYCIPLANRYAKLSINSIETSTVSMQKLRNCSFLPCMLSSSFSNLDLLLHQAVTEIMNKSPESRLIRGKNDLLVD